MNQKDVSQTSVIMLVIIGWVKSAYNFCHSPRSGIVAEDDIASIEEQNCKREAYLGL